LAIAPYYKPPLDKYINTWRSTWWLTRVTEQTTWALGASAFIRSAFSEPAFSEDLNWLGMAKASDVFPSASAAQRERRSLTYWRVIAIILTVTSLYLWTWPWVSPRISSMLADVQGSSDVPDIGFPESFLRSWAQYSPYIPVAKYAPPPPGCVVTQVGFNRNFSLLTHN